MKQLGYYPALVVILLLCAGLTAFFVCLSADVMKRMGKFKSSDETYRASLKQVSDEELALENSQRVDKIYSDYLSRWTQKEGSMDEQKLRQRLQKISDELQVTLININPLNALEGDVTAGKGGASANVIERRRSPMAERQASMPGGLTGTKGLVELKVSLSGSFLQLMAWIARAENELGSLRVVGTHWVARTPEEVRLTIGLRYKPIVAQTSVKNIAAAATGGDK